MAPLGIECFVHCRQAHYHKVTTCHPPLFMSSASFIVLALFWLVRVGAMLSVRATPTVRTPAPADLGLNGSSPLLVPSVIYFKMFVF